MKAMILAAGKGKRMGKASQKIPKPLTKIHQTTLIEHNILRIKNSGIKDIMINIAWLGEQILNKIGNGSKYGVNITYSDEGNEPIGTARGIRKIIDYFENQNFWVCNSDVYSDFEFEKKKLLKEGILGHIILVKNPDHHPEGDFSLKGIRVLPKIKNESYTYSGMSILSPKIFFDYQFTALEDVLFNACCDNNLSGEFYNGYWIDIGTNDRLQKASAKII